MDLAFSDRERLGSYDLEALELKTRDVMHDCGKIILEKLFELEDGSCLSENCECGGRFQNHKRESKTIRTVVGNVRVTRSIQHCNKCHSWRVPVDKVLDVEKTVFSAGLRRLMARVGGEVCFERGREFLWELAGVRVTAKEVERVSEAVGADILLREDQRTEAAMRGECESAESVEKLYITTDGAGVPVRRQETLGRKGKAADGIARTREAKLGVVFHQTKVDEKGRPVRDPGSTSYVGKIEEAEKSGERLYAEAVRRGLNQAKQVVVLGDGAPWIWNLFDLHFPGATQIVDFYHAAEHLSEIARLLYPEESAPRNEWFKLMRKKLKRGRVAEIIAEIKVLAVRGKKKEELEKALAYFEKNQERMRYGDFRKVGFFIGSGVVEAGCKSVIGKRLKQSGMHWSVRGANAIIALRCCIESGGFEDYWEERRAA